MKIKKLFKERALITLIALTVSCLFGWIGLYKTTARAEDAVTVESVALTMENGASVRFSSDNLTNGLRFRMEMTKTDYEGLIANTGEGKTYESVSFGMLIAPADYLTAGHELTVDNVFWENAIYGWAIWNGTEWVYDGNKVRIINLPASEMTFESESGKYVYSGSITNLRNGDVTDGNLNGVNNLAREFVGEGYIQYTTSETMGYKMADYADGSIANNTRSMAYVAQMAVADLEISNPSDKKINLLQTNYIDKVSGKTSSYTVQYYQENLDETYSLFETDNSLTGNIGSTVTAAEKTYDGFIYDSSVTGTVASGKILANGKLVLKKYYKRGVYILNMSDSAVADNFTTTQATLSFDNIYKYDGQMGSLKVLATDFYVDLTINSTLDITDYSYIEFYVFNLSNVDKGFVDFFTPSESGETQIVLKANMWTKIKLTTSSLTTLNGKKLRLYMGNWNDSTKNSEFYISDIVGIAGTATQGAVITLSDSAATGNFTTTQATLSFDKAYKYDGQRGSLKVLATDFYVDLTINSTLDITDYSYIEFYVFNLSNVDKGFVDFFTPSESGETQIVLKAKMWTKIRLTTSSLTTLNGKKLRLYMGNWNDSTIGSEFYISDIVGVAGTATQGAVITLSDSTAAGNFTTTQATLSFDKAYKYDGQRGSLKVLATDFYADLAINSTLDITDYSYIEFYVFNLSNVDKGFVDFFTPSESGETQIVLKANMWTKIRLPTSSLTTLNGKKLRLYMGNWNDSTIGSEFYISDIVGIQ